MFRTVPLSIIGSFELYTQQCYMSYRFADSLQAVLFQNEFEKLVHLVGFIIRILYLSQISQCIINWLVFGTETENVYCAVRAAYLTVAQVALRLQRVHLSYTLKMNASCHFRSPKLICVTISLSFYKAYVLLLRWIFHCIGPYILLVISNA